MKLLKVSRAAPSWSGEAYHTIEETYVQFYGRREREGIDRRYWVEVKSIDVSSRGVLIEDLNGASIRLWPAHLLRTELRVTELPF